MNGLSAGGHRKENPGVRDRVSEETALRISYLEHKTNESVWNRLNALVGPQEPLLATAKRRELAWFGHVTRHDNPSKTIPQGTLGGWGRRGRQRESWSDSVIEWTPLNTPALLVSGTYRPQWGQTLIGKLQFFSILLVNSCADLRKG